MNKLIPAIAVALFASQAVPVLANADAKGLLEGAKCNKCHAVEALGIEAKKADKGPDLSKSAANFEGAQAMADFIAKKAEAKSHWGKKKGKMVKHKKKYDKADLMDIANALMELK